MPHLKRYVVLGQIRDIRAWRRSQGVPPRDIYAVSTRNAHALRGGGFNLASDFEVVALPSWGHASQRVRAELKQNLVLVRQQVEIRDRCPAADTA